MAVDADHFTAHIDQWTARVAWVDRHISLDEGQIVTRVTLLGAHNAGGDGILKAKGRANGHDPFAHFETRDITDFDGRQASGLDFDHCHICAFVSTHDAGLEFSFVGQSDQDLVSAIYDVGVGHDEAIGRQNETRAHAFGLGRLIGWLRSIRPWILPRHVGHRYPEKATEQLLHLIVWVAAAACVRLDFFQGADIDHRGADLFHQFGEIRQAFDHLGLHPDRGQSHGREQPCAGQGRCGAERQHAQCFREGWGFPHCSKSPS